MRTMVSLKDTADPFAALCALERSCNPLALTSTQRDSPSDLSWHSSKQALIFDVGGMLWALPRSWITEVVRQPRLARIPNAARELQGLTNVRGILVPVLDLAALLGLAGSATTAPAVVICTALAACSWPLFCSDAPVTVRLPPAEMMPETAAPSAPPEV